MRRLWIKGSESHPRYEISRTHSRADNPVLGTLDPPYYTAVVGIDADPDPRARLDLRVRFLPSEEEGAPGSEHIVRVTVPPPGALDHSSNHGAFSILSYGGFQPFTTTTETVHRPDHARLASLQKWRQQIATVNPGDGGSQLAIRRLLAAAATRQPIRIGGRYDGAVPDPLLIIGNGDQVYMEPAYDSLDPDHPEAHPLSAWTIEERPKPRLPVEDFPRFADELYRAFWSFGPLDEALRSCPSVMTWDDHEVRDGFGSQGDESEFADYVSVAREAYIQHQMTRGPLTEAQCKGRPSLDQEVHVRGVSVFVMDLRGQRDINKRQVVATDQMERLERFLRCAAKRADDGGGRREFVLVSSIPIFHRFGKKRSNFLGITDSEYKDDIADAWDSEPNEAQWRKLVSLLVYARTELYLRPIVISGDLHRSSMLHTLYSSPDDPRLRTLAYEMICSGLASNSFDSGLLNFFSESWTDGRDFSSSDRFAVERWIPRVRESSEEETDVGGTEGEGVPCADDEPDGDDPPPGHDEAASADETRGDDAGSDDQELYDEAGDADQATGEGQVPSDDEAGADEQSASLESSRADRDRRLPGPGANEREPRPAPVAPAGSGASVRRVECDRAPAEAFLIDPDVLHLAVCANFGAVEFYRDESDASSRSRMHLFEAKNDELRRLTYEMDWDRVFEPESGLRAMVYSIGSVAELLNWKQWLDDSMDERLDITLPQGLR